jgi:hypothetical protein
MKFKKIAEPPVVITDQMSDLPLNSNDRPIPLSMEKVLQNAKLLLYSSELAPPC